MFRLYHYVGPAEIASAVSDVQPGMQLGTPDEVDGWLRQNRAELKRSGHIVQTFVVGSDGVLRVADRRSEHVACAGGEPVLAAGEISFELFGASINAQEITNQSTGYCPEPESWHAVSNALTLAGIKGPGHYTTAYDFRRCEQCGQINLLKDKIFECAVCESLLPTDWNFN